MSDQNNTENLIDEGGVLTGDALLHAVRGDLLQLFGLVKALDQKADALDAKVEARLRDTTPMWEVAVSRLDNIIVEQENHGRRLDEMEGRLDAMEGRLDAMEGRLGAMEGRLDAIDGRLNAMEGRLDRMEGRLTAIDGRLVEIEAKLERFDAIDSELRLLRRRIERTIGQLSKDVVEYRADQHDIEDRVEKLEKTPA